MNGIGSRTETAQDAPSGVEVNRLALTLLIGLAALIGLAPAMLILGRPQILPVLVLAAALGAFLFARHKTTVATYRPTRPEFLIAGCGGIFLQALLAVLWLLLYVLLYGILTLLLALASRLGLPLAWDVATIAFIATLVPAIFLVGVWGAVSCEDMFDQLYPGVPGVRSPLHGLVTYRGRMLIFATAIIVVLFAVGLWLTWEHSTRSGLSFGLPDALVHRRPVLTHRLDAGHQHVVEVGLAVDAGRRSATRAWETGWLDHREAVGLAQDELDLGDDVGGLGGVGVFALVDSLVANVHQRVEGIGVEVDQRPAQALGQVLSGAAGALETHQLAQGQLGERLAATHLLLRLDQLFLPRRRRLAERLVVQVHQQALERARRALHGLGVVLLLQEGSGFGESLGIVHERSTAKLCNSRSTSRRHLSNESARRACSRSKAVVKAGWSRVST